MIGKRRAFLVSVLLAAVLWPLSARAQSAISDITFDWGSYKYLARGSDNWPLTWCEDGHQYTSWGDGGGFGGTDSDGRVSLGFARIEGDYPNFTGVNVWGGKNPEHSAQFNGKSVSMLCLNGILYAWRSSGSNTGSFRWKQIIRSTDKGAHWQENAFPNSRLVGDCVGCAGLPFFINYGQDYTANTDGYVYIYTIRISDPTIWEVQKPGVMWLARAPASGEMFADTANWEWLTGEGPDWGAMSDRVPVLEDADGFMRSSAMYVPGLDRFVMVTNHTARNDGNIAFWEAPNPWGPWNLVWKKRGWPAGETDVVRSSFAFGGFSPKWLSADGRDCVFVWFRPDAWNSVACHFVTGGATDDTPPPKPTGLTATAVGSSRVDLSWTAVDDPESGISRYNVYRDDELVGSPQSAHFSDTGLSPNTTYTYEVAAVNGDRLEGMRSAPASITTEAEGPIVWSGRGGTMNANGLYTAGNVGGVYAIMYRSEELTDTVEVRILNPTGALQINASTSGDPGLTHYSVAVGAERSQAIGYDGSVILRGLRAGAYTVRLSDVPGTCTLSGPNPRTVSVVAGQTASIEFELTCDGHQSGG